MGDLQPRMRAGDADRATAVERLGRHLGEGRLTVEEFDERVTQAHAAVYLDELPRLFVDLPSDPPPVTPRRQRPQAWVPTAAFVVLAALVVSWSMIMANTSYIQFVLTDVSVSVSGDTAVVTCGENMLTGLPSSVADPTPGLAGGRAVATNVFRRTTTGWRLWVHHASPVLTSEESGA